MGNSNGARCRNLHAERAARETFIASQRSKAWVPVRAPYDGLDHRGIFGGCLDRRGLKRLREGIEHGLVGIVAVSKIGRLSRSATDFAKLVEVFDRNGESLFSLKRTASGPSCGRASAQPHTSRSRRKNPAAAGSGKRPRAGKWRRGRA
jgi:hypothetical protein